MGNWGDAGFFADKGRGWVGESPKTYLSAVLCAISMCVIAVLDTSR